MHLNIFRALRPAARRQKGFSLIEVLVALAILSALAYLATSAFDGSRTKAQVMIGLGKQLGDANIMLKTDTGCYVRNPQALFDMEAAAEPSNNYCNTSFGSTWSRPYLGKYPVNEDGEILAEKIGAGVTVSFPETAEAGGMGRRYYVRFSNVPMDVMRQGLIECNNDDASVGNFDEDRCRASSITGTAPGTFDIMFDETR